MKQAKCKQKEIMGKSKSIHSAILNFVSLRCPYLLNSLPMLTLMEEQREPCHQWQTESACCGRSVVDSAAARGRGFEIGKQHACYFLALLRTHHLYSLISSHFKRESRSSWQAMLWLMHLYECKVEALKHN